MFNYTDSINQESYLNFCEDYLNNEKELLKDVIFYDINNSWFNLFDGTNMQLQNLLNNASLNLNKNRRLYDDYTDPVYLWINQLLCDDNFEYTIVNENEFYTISFKNDPPLKKLFNNKPFSKHEISTYLNYKIDFILNKFINMYIERNTLSLFDRILISLSLKNRISYNFDIQMNTNDILPKEYEELNDNKFFK